MRQAIDATATVYETDDLPTRTQAIVDEARAGEARLRDRDGFGLVMLPEQRVRFLEVLSRCATNLVGIERDLASNTPLPLSPDAYGDWPWLKEFDAEDLQEFVREMRSVLMEANREVSLQQLEETLHAWQATAEALPDPVRREILLGRPRYEDFVEVTRPE